MSDRDSKKEAARLAEQAGITNSTVQTYYQGQAIDRLKRERDDAVRQRDEARAEVKRLEGVCELADELRFAVADEADALRAQRDTYRDALEKIEDTDCGDFPQAWEQDGCLEAVQAIKRIAGDALTGDSRKDF